MMSCLLSAILGYHCGGPLCSYEPVRLSKAPQTNFVSASGAHMIEIDYEFLPLWAYERVIQSDPRSIIVSSSMTLRSNGEVTWSRQYDRIVWGGHLADDGRFYCVTSGLQAGKPAFGVWGGEGSPYSINTFSPEGVERVFPPQNADKPGGRIHTLFAGTAPDCGLIAHAHTTPEVAMADSSFQSEIWSYDSAEGTFKSRGVLNPLIGESGRFYVITDMVPVAMNDEGSIVCAMRCSMSNRHFDKDDDAACLQFEGEGCATRVLVFSVDRGHEPVVMWESDIILERRPEGEFARPSMPGPRLRVIRQSDGSNDVVALATYGDEPASRVRIDAQAASVLDISDGNER